jgi:hypothetical protein
MTTLVLCSLCFALGSFNLVFTLTAREEEQRTKSKEQSSKENKDGVKSKQPEARKGFGA